MARQPRARHWSATENKLLKPLWPQEWQQDSTGKTEPSASQLRNTNRELQRRIAAQQFLMEAAHYLGGTLYRRVLLDRLVHLISKKLELQDFRLTVHLEPRAVRASGLLNSKLAGLVHRVEEKLVDSQPRVIRPSLIGNVQLPSGGLGDGSRPQPGFILCIPMLHGQNVVGTLSVCSPESDGIGHEEVEVLIAFCTLAATALVNADMYETIRRLSLTDPLTGLLNRRAMEQRLFHEIARAKRSGLPLTVLVIDVDHLKLINDRMGHLLGDRVLRSVAKTLRKEVRQIDAVARFGGDEFCIILPESGEPQGYIVANKQICAVEKLTVTGSSHQLPQSIRISVGIAEYTGKAGIGNNGSTLQKLLGAADRAMFFAKKTGRNRAVRASRLSRHEPYPSK